MEELSYFLDVDFRMDSPGHSKALSPHVTKQVRLPKDGEAVFPLKKHYGATNFTFEGMSGAMSTDDVVFDLPTYPDEDPEQSGEDPADEQDRGGVDPTERKGTTLDKGDPFWIWYRLHGA